MKKNKLWVKITALIIAIAFAASTAYVAIDAMIDGSTSSTSKRPEASRPAASRPVSK